MKIQDKIIAIKNNPEYEGYRQTQMAAIIGISHNTYVNYLKGKSSPANPIIIERINKLYEESK
ncbi:MAG: helix-turn-helix transcriptional regulator [Candidatus Atribacteria bacterium]|nr:helix-turn-helix transcriptional regulator [Candidatus Atribacteria bacterium]